MTPTLMLTALFAIAAPDNAFDQLKTLAPGRFTAKTENGATIKVTYRLVSNESVLVQSYVTASGKETLTVFHVDGDRVIATHYCAQGNQPRLRLDRTQSKDPNTFVFVFLDATNLPKPTAAHLKRLELRRAGTGKYTQIETYEENGKAEVTTLEFTRAIGDPEPM